MKIKTVKSIACAAAIALALSVTACGGSKDSANAADTAKVEDTADAAEPEEANNDEAEVSDEANVEEEASVEEAGANEAAFSSLEEAFSDPTVKKVFEDALGLESMNEDGMSMSYEVSGNEFIYIFQFTDDSIEPSDEITEYLSSALEAQAGVFEEAAGQLDESIGQEGACSVTVRYIAANDEVLYENTYSAN